MTITLTLPVLLTAITLAVVFAVHIVVIARWTAKTQVMVEGHDASIKELHALARSVDERIMDSRHALRGEMQAVVGKMESEHRQEYDKLEAKIDRYKEGRTR